MSILIKGMEMPKCCAECKMYVEDIYCCHLLHREIENPWADDGVELDCPLVLVPPHGRLGDLDEINEKHDKLSRDFCHGYFKNTWDFVCAARKIFYDAPTIIPAEEEQL